MRRLPNTFLLLALIFTLLAANVSEARPGGGGRGGAGRATRPNGGGARGGSQAGGQRVSDAGGGRIQNSGQGPSLGGTSGKVSQALQGSGANAQQVQSFLNSGALQPQAGQFRGQASQFPASQKAGQREQSRFNQEQFSAQLQQLQQNAQNWMNEFQSGPEPFSPQWYAEHPQAWQYAHPHADAWAAASLTAATAWLGWPAYDTGGSTTVVNETTIYANEDESTLATSDPSSADPVNADAAATSEAEWLSLGVFALSPLAGGGQQAVQLAINRQGSVSGVLIDNLLGVSVNVTGEVNQADQSVRWRLESNPQVEFTASLETLTSGQGEVRVRGVDGSAQTWIAVRLETPAS